MELLRVDGIVKSFGKQIVVQGVSLSIAQGEIVGLIGPNGAGKSTTLSMISTLLSPEKGEIYYKGQSIKKRSKLFRSKIGVVPQEIALYSGLSGYENLRFWGQAYGLPRKILNGRIEKVCEVIGLGDSLHKAVHTYSGGMKRRINIGAAILHDPELLIMDEPTVGLDPESRQAILQLLKDCNQQGMAILYTSHYLKEVEELCHKVYIMECGRVMAGGPIETIKKQYEKQDLEEVYFAALHYEK